MPISTKELNLYSQKNDSNGGPPQPLTHHLNELRTKIIISFLASIIATMISFTFSKEIINMLIKIAPEGTVFLQIKPGELFFTSIKIAFYCGFMLSSPIIMWQLISFIFPGLNEKEKKISVPIAIASPLLFFFGSNFAYFFVAPSMLNFLFGFGKDIISTSISVEHFVSFVIMITAMCGIIFLLPVIIFALANGGIVNAKILIGKWKYALLVCVILGAILTPTPDPFNMCIISGILISLYFLSIGILKLSKK